MSDAQNSPKASPAAAAATPTPATPQVVGTPLSVSQEDLKGKFANADAVKSKLGDLVCIQEDIPVPVQRRVRALKKLQDEHDNLEKQFNAEQLALELKYEGLYAPLYNKRSSIVKGDVEPAESDLPEGAQLPPVAEDAAAAAAIKGIPGFWLAVLQNCRPLAQEITERDVKILSHLTNIRSRTLPDNQGFELGFEFSANEFFTELDLVKTYHVSSDGEVENATGTKISWAAGKNPTVRTVTKKAKSRGKGPKKTITTTEPCESFFTFFSPPNLEEPEEEEDPEELAEALEVDFTFGELIKDQIIPHAVDWYTGEASLEDEDDDEDDEDDEDDDDDDDDDDEDDEDERPRKKAGKKGPTLKDESGKVLETKKDGKDTSKPPECKQQ
eukprot:gnl/Hemi2/25919_TR8710_c0_g1_i2.p2 gnl/Hemi2/25919_TR8710_c0_g1~~gnl/Hemi2/25919_TR8710_c0_g1_i2.p2  ORF type:complete len:385 (+),score=206.10 gnl/Hemi2/25919_TR8710_c0_g1_i2:110-1264(+)